MAKVTIAIGKTSRGFHHGQFLDRNGQVCSVQKSSVAFEELLWLGMDEPSKIDGLLLSRMHLTQAHVRALLPILHAFVETGELPEGEFVGED